MSSSPMPTPLRVALVAAGRVGTAVAHHLRAAGHQIAAVTSRNPASAERAADLLEAPVVSDLRGVPVVDLVIVGATESAIADIARGLAQTVAPGTVVMHLAGVFGLAPLEPLAASGARPAALHPVQSMPDVDTAIARLPGSAWGVTCAPADRDWAHALIRQDLRGEPFDVREEDRPLWHAASVGTSNGVAALMSVGERILTELGIEFPERVLGPLAAGTVANAREGGGGGATLTGPIVRGEVASVQRHLEALRRRDPRLASAYALAASVVLEAAEAARRIDERTASDFHLLLGTRR